MDIRKIGVFKPYPVQLSWVVIGLVSLMMPSFLSKLRVRTIQTPLVIQTSKIEPPRVAFDSVVKAVQKFQSWPELEALPQTNLNDIVSGSAGRPLIQKAVDRMVVLQPMVIRRDASQVQMPTMVAELKPLVQERANIENLSFREQQRIQMAQEKFGTLDEDWNLPNFRDLASETIAEAQKNLSKNESPVTIIAKNDDGTVRTPESIRTASIEMRTLNRPGHQVAGNVELAGGLPFGPGWRINISRFEDGVQKEIGSSNANGQFQIQVPELAGAVYAQLVDTEKGVVLGEGSLRLSSYDNPEKLRSSKIIIQKNISEVAGRYRSFYDVASGGAGKKSSPRQALYSPTLDQEAQTDASGSFQFDRVAAGSWMLLRGQGKGHSPTLSLIRAGGEKNLTAFPEGMINGLKSIVRDQNLYSMGPETGAVIWGQVSRDGHPVDKVDVVLESFPDLKPVYFNSLMMPDPSLKMTGENGYFAFVDVPVGLHSVIASQARMILGHNNVVIDEHSVSQADIQTSFKKDEAAIKVFDAFMGTPEDAILEMQSLDQALEVHGSAVVQLPTIERKSYVRVMPTSPEYVPFLTSYEEMSDFVHIPLIRKDWLDGIHSQRKINLDVDHGVIVGFVQSEDFEVFLSHDPEFASENINYFDARGQVVEKGVAGGGFILWNANPGVHSVVILTSRSEMLQSDVTTIDPASISVVKFR